MSNFVSASSLSRCGWARVLKKKRPRTPNMIEAGDRGSVFHKAIEDWARTGILEWVEDLEIQGWIDVLCAQWRPRKGMHFEEVFGLGQKLEWVATHETEPGSHVYKPDDPTKTIITGGRVDVWWAAASIHLRKSEVTRTVFVLDWKTGSYPPEDPRTNLQFWSAAIALADRVSATQVVTGAYLARDGVFEWSDPVTVGSEEWAERQADVLEACLVGDEARPGVNCDGCWEKKACSHYERLMKESCEYYEGVMNK